MKRNNFPLDETGDLTVFKVPEKYFENFGVQLSQRLDAIKTEKDLSDKKVQSDTSPTRRYIFRVESARSILYMAAMFVVIIFSVSMILNFTSKKSSIASAGIKSKTENTELTAEDYLISSVGTYGISQYYVDPENFE